MESENNTSLAGGLQISRIHHVAIICSDYLLSRHFYSELLGFQIAQEIYREDRKSYKLDLIVGGEYQIELFSFPDPPKRQSRPEATGLRHLAFEVINIHDTVTYLNEKGIVTEPVRIDDFTGKKYTFFSDPDGLPLECYEK